MIGRDIAGYHMNLHSGFDQLGVENHFFYERTHPFYKVEKTRYFCEKIIIGLNDFALNLKTKFIIKAIVFIALYPIVLLFKTILFPKLIKKYDVFIFGTNYSYFGLYIDRVLLKFFNKTIIDVVSGSDVRPPYINGVFQDVSIRKLYWLTKLKFFKLCQKYKFSTYIIDHPTVSQFNTRDYIPFLYVGFPFSLPESKSIEKRKVPLILHAPSNPKAKGTDIIREVIHDLKKEYKFDYEELSGVSHATVIDKLGGCHFIINELYSDTPMSGLDTEAAWHGKPSVVGGYNWDIIDKNSKGFDLPPTYRVEPTREALRKAIIHLLTDQKYAQSLGEKARKFVKEKWSSKAVAQKYLNIMNGDIPENIMRSPFDDFDIHGGGVNAKDRRKIVSQMISKYGEKSLCLDNKPQVKQMILDDCR